MSRPLSVFLLCLIIFGLIIVEKHMAGLILAKDEGKRIREEMTYLQMHVSFFDLNIDGVIYPWESFAGFRQLDYSLLFSTFLTILFHGIFSFPTLPSWIPSPLLPIYIANIHEGKHGSDTMNYDYDGRFDEKNFEELVNKYAKTKPDRLSIGELWRMTEDHRVLLDFFGWMSAKIEFGLLYFLAKDDDGFLSKEAFYRVYNGSLFYNHAKKVKENKLKSS